MIDGAVLVRQLLLVGSLWALGGAAWRLAARLAVDGLERALATVVLMAAGAVLESLALGLAGLGGTSVALAGAALLTWVIAWRRLAPSRPGPVAELRAWWGGRSIAARVGLGALGGAAAALALTQLRRPELGFDGITYHVPEVVGFVQSGHPGEVLQVFYGLPVGNYPLTNEVLLAWLTGLSHGLAALTLWSPASGLVLIAAGWLGLRQLGVPTGLRILALAALLLGPLIVVALAQPGTDLPALTWLACCVSLGLAARRRPRLLCAAIVALGLAVGTKSTVALYGAVAMGAFLWVGRAELRGHARALTAASVAAAAVGLPWYLRDVIQHGSPLWPFLALPWGDPEPELLKVLSKTLAGRLQYTLLDNISAYLTATAGLVVLLVGGVVVPALARRRRTVIAAAVVALGAVAWANSPLTGLPDGDFLAGAVGSTVRYLMPVFAAGAAALALTAADGPRSTRAVSVAALLGALGWGLQSDLQHGFYLAFSSWLAPGVILGALLAGLAGPLGARVRLTGVGVGLWVTAVLLSALAALGLALGSHHFVARHAAIATETDSAVVAYLSSQPGFADSHVPIATTPVTFGPLAGDRLQHRLALIGQHESCRRVLGRVARGYVVLGVVHPVPVPGHPGVTYPHPGSAQRCLAPVPPLFASGVYRVYGTPPGVRRVG